MKLVTFQSNSALKDLYKKGYLECNKNKIDLKKMGSSYKWIINKMNKYISNPYNVEYPIWCWVKCYNRIYPPKKKGEKVKGFDVKITFHKEEKDIFITDYRRYSFLLNNIYIPETNKDKITFEDKLKKYNITQKDLKTCTRTDKEFIDICNDIEKTFDRCITKDSNILQGCVWRISIDEIEKVEILEADGYIYGSLNYIEVMARDSIR